MIIESLNTFMRDAIGGPFAVTAGDIPTHEVTQIKSNNTAMMKTYLLYGGIFKGEMFTIQKQKYNPEKLCYIFYVEG